MGKSWESKRFRCFACMKWFTSKQQLHAHNVGRKHAKKVASLTPSQIAAVEATRAEAEKPKLEAPRTPLEVLYRDEHLLAVNKPPGLVVHRSALCPGETDSVLDRLRWQFPSLAEHLRPCHRLDRQTSGVTLFALSAECSRRMAVMFEKKTRSRSSDVPCALRKLYFCVTRGHFETPRGEIERPLPLSRFEDRKRKGKLLKPAVTQWRRLSQCVVKLRKSPNPRQNTIYEHARLSTLLLEPLTGRFHQIRRHLADRSVSKPIIGDRQHGDSKLNRSLAFTFYGEEHGPVNTEHGITSIEPAVNSCSEVRAQIAKGQIGTAREEHSAENCEEKLRLQLHALCLDFQHPMRDGEQSPQPDTSQSQHASAPHMRIVAPLVPDMIDFLKRAGISTTKLRLPEALGEALSTQANHPAAVPDIGVAS